LNDPVILNNVKSKVSGAPKHPFFWAAGHIFGF
jgi:hypothetical protein